MPDDLIYLDQIVTSHVILYHVFVNYFLRLKKAVSNKIIRVLTINLRLFLLRQLNLKCKFDFSSTPRLLYLSGVMFQQQLRKSWAALVRLSTRIGRCSTKRGSLVKLTSC